MQDERGALDALVLPAVLPLRLLLDVLDLQCRRKPPEGSMRLAIHTDPCTATRRPARANSQIRMTKHDCRLCRRPTPCLCRKCDAPDRSIQLARSFYQIERAYLFPQGAAS